VTGEWRMLHNEELNDLYSLPSIVRVVKSRRMRRAGHVARGVGGEASVITILIYARYLLYKDTKKHLFTQILIETTQLNYSTPRFKSYCAAAFGRILVQAKHVFYYFL